MKVVYTVKKNIFWDDGRNFFIGLKGKEFLAKIDRDKAVLDALIAEIEVGGTIRFDCSKPSFRLGANSHTELCTLPQFLFLLYGKESIDNIRRSRIVLV